MSDSVKQVRQFVGFIGYYRRFIQNFAGLSEPLAALTKGVGRLILDTDASLFAVGGVLNQLQGDREVVIAYASCSLRLYQRCYCTTRREMLAAVAMCTHFHSYPRAAD